MPTFGIAWDDVHRRSPKHPLTQTARMKVRTEMMNSTVMRCTCVLLTLTVAIFVHQNEARAQVTASDGVIQIVPEIAKFDTFGPDMAGMSVTAHFDGGGSETVVWQPDGAGGKAAGTGWELVNPTNPFHTFASPWTLNYDGSGPGNLVGLEFDGFAKFDQTNDPNDAVVFDVSSFEPFAGGSTPGSAAGLTIQSLDLDFTAHYTDRVKLDSNLGAPVGDLYRRLRVDFKENIRSKFSQLPREQVGENLWSDVDWRFASTDNGDVRAVADDFISNGDPIIAVRWWGSYFNPEFEPVRDPNTLELIPRVEDGFLISFLPNTPSAAGGPDQPGAIPDASYIAPIDNVRITPTSIVGWDQHPVWQYEVRLDATFLDHGDATLASPEAFLELAGEEYWLSIAALDGADIDPNTGEIKTNNDAILTSPFWGWHTTPEVGFVDLDGDGVNDFLSDDAPVGSRVAMPGANIWEYLDWQEIDQQHTSDLPNNLAFELLTFEAGLNGLDGTNSFEFFQDTDTATVPEPTTALLLVGAGVLGLARRRAA